MFRGSAISQMLLKPKKLQQEKNILFTRIVAPAYNLKQLFDYRNNNPNDSSFLKKPFKLVMFFFPKTLENNFINPKPNKKFYH